MPQFMYRIYTEDTPLYEQVVKKELESAARDYTIIKGMGSWKHTEEHTLIAEVMTTFPDMATMKRIAGRIKVECQQEAILVTETAMRAEMI